jgi:acyl dehydratase
MEAAAAVAEGGLTMQHYAQLTQLQALVGQEIGLSDWVVVDQQRIQRFADATGDHQWIHLDAERAAAGPFGSTIAHGYLTLSLLPLLFASAFDVAGIRMGVNYGLNKVRFPAPVPVNSRLRARFVLQAYDELPGGAQLTIDTTIEREGGSKPVCVAQALSRLFV